MIVAVSSVNGWFPLSPTSHFNCCSSAVPLKYTMAQVGPGVGEEPRFTKNGRMMIPVRDVASIGPEEPPVEWHTNSHVHEQELQRMKAERQELNKIEKKAQQRKLETEENARTEEAEILERANKADAFRVVEFAALRERLAEQKENAITLEEETDAKVEELSDEAKVFGELLLLLLLHCVLKD